MKQRRIFIEEKTLVEGLKAHNHHSFNIFFNNYGHVIRDSISRIVPNNTETQDLTQDALIKIWENIDKYDESKGKLFTWIINLSQNLAIDYVRSLTYKTQKLNQTFEYDIVYDDKITTQKLNFIGFNQYLIHLKPFQMQLIEMFYFEGYTLEQISQKLEIPEGTIKTNLYKVVHSLKSRIIADER